MILGVTLNTSHLTIQAGGKPVSGLSVNCISTMMLLQAFPGFVPLLSCSHVSYRECMVFVCVYQSNHVVLVMTST